MSDGSAISWTEATWNFITGCTRISDGCTHCYIERTPPFRMAHRRFDKPGIGGKTGVVLHPDRLDLPLRWRKPRRIFVNSLADIFHEDVPDEFIAQAFAMMAATPHHTFQVLTKRHGRMRALLNSPDFRAQVQVSLELDVRPPIGYRLDFQVSWPLPNVWVGVSVESQQWADVRIPALLATPAAVRWLSCEPLLGPLDLRYCGGVDAIQRDWIGGPSGGSGAPHPLIDWAVIGGESGPGARPMDLAWASRIVADCRRAEVPVFVKQLGSPAGRDHHDIETFPADLRVREYPIPAPDPAAFAA